tara:strand:+ start:431 stop:709 length:279 start_codon:yes stop_codon:yes gene_type:complete
MDNQLIVIVKKYFDDINGNTYHSVQFDINGKTYHSGKTYGYERQYEQTYKNMEINYNPNISLKEKAKRIEFLSNPKYIIIEDCKECELDQIQ